MSVERPLFVPLPITYFRVNAIATRQLYFVLFQLAQEVLYNHLETTNFKKSVSTVLKWYSQKFTQADRYPNKSFGKNIKLVC